MKVLITYVDLVNTKLHCLVVVSKCKFPRVHKEKQISCEKIICVKSSTLDLGFTVFAECCTFYQI